MLLNRLALLSCYVISYQSSGYITGNIHRGQKPVALSVGRGHEGKKIFFVTHMVTPPHSKQRVRVVGLWCYGSVILLHAAKFVILISVVKDRFSYILPP
jgi:hypothetical protein